MFGCQQLALQPPATEGGRTEIERNPYLALGPVRIVDRSSMKGEENQESVYIHQDQENIQHEFRVFPESSTELPNQESLGTNSVCQVTLHGVQIFCNLIG